MDNKPISGFMPPEGFTLDPLIHMAIGYLKHFEDHAENGARDLQVAVEIICRIAWKRYGVQLVAPCQVKADDTDA